MTVSFGEKYFQYIVQMDSPLNEAAYIVQERRYANYLYIWWTYLIHIIWIPFINKCTYIVTPISKHQSWYVAQSKWKVEYFPAKRCTFTHFSSISKLNERKLNSSCNKKVISAILLQTSDFSLPFINSCRRCCCCLSFLPKTDTVANSFHGYPLSASQKVRLFDFKLTAVNTTAPPISPEITANSSSL